MPTINVNGVQISYQEYGAGAETIVFSHGYFYNSKMYAHQIDALKDRYRIIAYDHRCHGDSEIYQEPFGMYDLVNDGIGVIEQVAGGPVHFMGMSTGGYVGVRLMAKRPDLLKSVVLMDTTAEGEPSEAIAGYDQLLDAIKAYGIAAVYDNAAPLLMGEKFRTDATRSEQYESWKQIVLANDALAMFHFGKAIFSRDSVIEALQGFALPTQIIIGEHDLPTPMPYSQNMLAAFANTNLAVIPDSGHSSPFEEPAAVTAVIEKFMASL